MKELINFRHICETELVRIPEHDFTIEFLLDFIAYCNISKKDWLGKVDHKKTIYDFTRKIAMELKVVGLLNIQYAIYEDAVYIL